MEHTPRVWDPHPPTTILIATGTAVTWLSKTATDTFSPKWHAVAPVTNTSTFKDPNLECIIPSKNTCKSCHCHPRTPFISRSLLLNSSMVWTSSLLLQGMLSLPLRSNRRNIRFMCSFILTLCITLPSGLLSGKRLLHSDAFLLHHPLTTVHHSGGGIL